MSLRVALVPVLLLAAACSSTSVDPNKGTAGAAGAGADGAAGADGGAGAASGVEEDVVELSVSPDARTFVELSGPSVVDVKGDGQGSIAWDLALQGRDVFSNGGISGPGNAAAFGPLSLPTFLSDTAPEVPIMLKDRAGGALLDWYEYVGGTEHLLYSRYHVYGLREGARLFKLQILSYYGEQQGAPVSALYRVRYAEVLEDGSGEIHEVAEIDATAGGDAANDEHTSGCLDLDTEQITQLTPGEAADSDAWQLCFRREEIAVNGGLSGPRGVEAVDLQSADTVNETEAEIMARTETSEQALFDGIDTGTLSDPKLSWKQDGVATAFARRWLEPGTEPAELSATVWLVLAADGASKYLMKFESLSGDLGNDTAHLSLRAKSVR